ncbi:RecBCD enzyme subunit RecC [Jeongeupia chitinilytica]|uniref:RecBCD enzyme subunit RecC n=2 Tax=Jeongeupia chitinilytica TaxID=1041641 RepID=A0ABQ3H0S1_9NEIS|nr:RecBCD enzyme subunit RecC [Jeongeupia chitinilytica]
MNERELPPGLMVIHGNRPEALRDVLVSWMTRHPLAPLDQEVILVQSNGIAQWLKLALARDVADGGCGIAAAIDAQLPSRFLWQAYRAVLGEAAVPLQSPFDKPLLVWRLMRLLPALLAEPVFAPLARFLDGDDDLRKRHQLAERLADLFDQYQVYRADWLADWAGGDDVISTSRRGREPLPDSVRWQPRLWRALLTDVGADPGDDRVGTSRAEVHRCFLETAQTLAQRPHGLPQRLLVFGISSLPQQSLEVLSALSRWTQVLMCVHNPCEHFWGDIIADKDLLRAERARQARKAGAPVQLDDTLLHLHAHPLLAAWGKQGRDFIGLLDAHDQRENYESRFADIRQRIDLFDGNGGATLLNQLQDDILDLRPLSETKARWPVVAATDVSVRFHVTHSPQREVEVLHDQLLDALATDPTLLARDIIVMVPDINAYAPHIQAVFGLLDPHDPRFIPFTLADQGQRHHDPLLGAVEKLLDLPQSRLAVSDLLDLLEVPALRQRFGIAEDQLPLLHRWVAAARVRWGLHAEQRSSLELPQAFEQNSWFFGLRRMLLGYAVGSGDAWGGIEPMDEIGGLDAALLGPLACLLERLDAHWRVLREPADPDGWCERLRALLGDFFDADDGDDGFTLMRLDDLLQQWQDACAAARLTEVLPLSVVREYWLAQLDQSSLSQPFFAGAVTFATLMPMRAIPFRMVCLLGMNDGDYPRTRVPMDFDLMGHDYRPGDRSRREDDRYLFLEALLSARDRLHVSWVGRSIFDNSERPPSVLVAQLRDHLAAGWQLDGAHEDGALLHALTIEHRLQPFNRDYFGTDPRLFSYAREWREGLAGAAEVTPVPAPAAQMSLQFDLPEPAAWRQKASEQMPLPPLAWDGTLSLRQLADFLRDPVRSFFRQRLGVYFEIADPASEDHEPFAIDALENWRLQDELIRAQLAALDRGEAREPALLAQLERIERRGELPPGQFAAVLRNDLAEPMDDLFARHAAALADWPHALPDEEIDDASMAPGVADWLSGLRSNDAGERARVLLESNSLLKDRAYRRDKLVPYWVAHLAGHLGGAPLTSVIVGKNGTVTLPALDPEVARAHWRTLRAAWCDGLNRPLPLALKTALAWLAKGGRAGAGPFPDALRAARDCYELHDPDNKRFAERAENPYLARAWPDFDALSDGDGFASLADALLRPLHDALDGGKGRKEDA